MRIIALLFICMAQFVNAQEKLLLVGTYTYQSSKGIYTYSFNEDNGQLKLLNVTEAKNPSYLTISQDKKWVYAVSENDNGGLVNAYAFNSTDGSLKLINSQPSNGGGPCHITVDNSNKYVMVANYGGGNFCVYPVSQDGSLGAAVQNFQHTGSSVNKVRQGNAHAHQVQLTPDQKYLAVVNLGTDKIYLYPFDASRQKPVNEKPIEIKSDPGAGPRHIVFHPSRPYAYVIEELSGYVSAYRFKNGKATHIQHINAHPSLFTGDIGSAAIKISADGKFLYASNRGASNTIAAFAIEPSLGKLRLKEIYPTKGNSPRDFAISPSGKYLITTNSRSNTVAVFKRNIVSGELTGEPQLTGIPEAVCLVFAE